MKITKARNRENRTKAKRPTDIQIIQIKLSREAYDRVKELERSKVCTREDIFMSGLNEVS